MAKKPKYRLEVLLIIKDRARQKREIELAKALKRLAEEKKQLEKLNKEKRQLEERIKNEYQEMRTKVSSGHARMKDPQVHLNFIRKLKEDLEELERKIEDQAQAVKAAERHLQRCRSDYILAAQEHNMMVKHKELWEKKMRNELTAQDNKQMNELGNVIHQINKMK